MSGLIYCEHCGQPMHASSQARHDRKGRDCYQYPRYMCSSYNVSGQRNKAGCGCYWIKADLVQGWLVKKLQEIFLGPGREGLVDEIQKQLRGKANTSRADAGRLG